MNRLLTAACSLGMLGSTPDGFVDRLCVVLDEYRAGQERVDTAKGTIESVATDSDTFVLRTEDEASLTVSVTDTTKYTLNGAESKREEALATGRQATVTHEAGVATRVDVVIEDP